MIQIDEKGGECDPDGWEGNASNAGRASHHHQRNVRQLYIKSIPVETDSKFGHRRQTRRREELLVGHMLVSGRVENGDLGA